MKRRGYIYDHWFSTKIPLYVDLRERWRHWGDREGLQREFLVQDPDGYLVMVNQKIAEQPVPPETF